MVHEITPEERTCDVHIHGLHRWKLEDGLVVPTVSIGVHVFEHGGFLAESRVQVDALHGNGAGKVQHISSLFPFLEYMHSKQSTITTNP